MTSTIQKLVVGIALLSLGGAGTFTVTWLASASDSHNTTKTEEVEQTEMGKVVESNTALLEKLSERQIEQDAAKAQTIKLCNADTISDCRTCKDVGVFDTLACKKK